MRKVILKLHVSLDGYLCAARGDAMEWVFRSYDDKLKAWELAQLRQAGVHAMGRALYEEMAAYWPNSTDAFAEPMNHIPKLVFSNTLAEATWPDTSIARGDAPHALQRLLNEPNTDQRPILVHGGASLVQGLLRHQLIDEMLLIVHPVALAKGLPLFTTPVDLRLISSRSFPAGAVLMVYGRS
ncbi:dihydrofolate reductase family protein [Variovorax sp. HJSM1_2]|uniref:dihydrofolate reductase family protein n=1 Tax=Variovorax sp. HJSM1_2 TaxID=3366263 RepID=UPI003BC61D11